MKKRKKRRRRSARKDRTAKGKVTRLWPSSSWPGSPFHTSSSSSSSIPSRNKTILLDQFTPSRSTLPRDGSPSSRFIPTDNSIPKLGHDFVVLGSTVSTGSLLFLTPSLPFAPLSLPAFPSLIASLFQRRGKEDEEEDIHASMQIFMPAKPTRSLSPSSLRDTQRHPWGRGGLFVLEREGLLIRIGSILLPTWTTSGWRSMLNPWRRICRRKREKKRG